MSDVASSTTAAAGTTAAETTEQATTVAAVETDTGFTAKLRREVAYFETYPVEFLKKIEAVAKAHFG